MHECAEVFTPRRLTRLLLLLSAYVGVERVRVCAAWTYTDRHCPERLSNTYVA